MLRSGFLVSVGGTAAALTLLLLPTVRASADREITMAPVSASEIGLSTLRFDAPGFLRPVSFEISPIHDRPTIYATMPRPSASSPIEAQRPATTEMPKPRRLTREGCEAPLSSLVGPEARRMVPGRCMA